jgi:hypothetical protein
MTLKKAAQTAFSEEDPSFADVRAYMEAIVSQMLDIGFDPEKGSNVVQIHESKDNIVINALVKTEDSGCARIKTRPLITLDALKENGGIILKVTLGAGGFDEKYKNIFITHVEPSPAHYKWKDRDDFENEISRWILDYTSPEIAAKLLPEAKFGQPNLKAAALNA